MVLALPLHLSWHDCNRLGKMTARNTLTSSKKELQNYGAEGMVQNQHRFGVFAP
jgi:hypothetical protein